MTNKIQHSSTKQNSRADQLGSVVLSDVQQDVKNSVESTLKYNNILSEEQKKKLLEFCREKPNFGRVTLLRHLPVEYNEEYITLKKELSDSGKLEPEKEAKLKYLDDNDRVQYNDSGDSLLGCINLVRFSLA